MKKIHLVILAPMIFGLWSLTNCGGSTSISNLGPDQLFKNGMEAFEKGKYLRAIESFQTVIYNFPGESNIDSAQYYLALSYLENGEEGLAAVEFNRLALNYPSSEFFPKSMFYKAISYFKGTPKHYGLDQSELEIAIKQLEDFIIDFPESENLDEARKFLQKANDRMAHKYYETGIVYFRIGAYTGAKKYFQLVIDDYTNSEFASLALYNKAEIEFKIRKYSEAKRLYENFLILFDSHEYTLKVEKQIIEASYYDALAEYEKGEFESAKTKFENYKTKFPLGKNIKEVNKHLDIISQKSVIQSQVTDAES